MKCVVSFFGVEPIRIGGTETYARELSLQLNKHGWHSVLCFLTPPSDELREFLSLPNVSLEIFAEETVRPSFRSIGKMARLLRTYKPDILHLHYAGFLGPYPWLAKLLGVEKVFFTDHSSQPIGYEPTRAPGWKRLVVRLINWPVGKVICVSNYGHQCLIKRGLLTPDKYQMVYNGVDLNRLVLSEERAAEFRRRFSIPDDRKIVLQVSWIIPEKGITDLLAAAQIVIARDPGVQFVIVGEGAYREQYTREANEMGLSDHLTWTGLIQDPFGEGVYDAADVVCQVSRWGEVFGWVIAEGMAYGKPIVATLVGGIPELVRDQESGFLVPGGDVEAIADRILKLVGSTTLRDSMGQTGQADVSLKFNLRKNVATLVDSYGIENSRSEMKIEVKLDSDADALIKQPQFLEDWRQLYADCPWGTVFQSDEFVLTWYRAYQDRFTPVFVVGTEPDGKLAGLLTLAISSDGGELVAAGSILAEYQVWLARPEGRNVFIEGALKKLSEHFPRLTLRFLTVPAAAPLEWTAPDRPLGRLCVVREMQRPLTEIGSGDSFRQSLAGKRYKPRLNKLRQLGDLRFERVTEVDGLSAIYQEVTSYAALRLAASHNVSDALNPDPLKKAFYLEMMKIPGLLHATVLRLDDKLVSAQINVRNRNEVLLGFITHSPFFAKYSPGRLHLLMLAVKLAEEGVPVLDLTPGVSEYKDWFATHSDQVRVVTIFFNESQLLRERTLRTVQSAASSLLDPIGVSPRNALEKLSHLKRKTTYLKVSTLPSKLGRRMRRIRHTRELRIYEFDPTKVPTAEAPAPMMRNSIPDLLAFRATEAWQPPVNEFLKQSLADLEAGAHIFTYQENGILLHYGWLIERQAKSLLSEVGQEMYFPPDSVVLTNYYTHPQARGRGLYQASLAQMMQFAAQLPDIKHIFIAVLADNVPSRHVIEKAGFVYRFSFFRKSWLGKTTCWSSAPVEFTQPPPSGSQGKKN